MIGIIAIIIGCCCVTAIIVNAFTVNHFLNTFKEIKAEIARDINSAFINGYEAAICQAENFHMELDRRTPSECLEVLKSEYNNRFGGNNG